MAGITTSSSQRALICCSNASILQEANQARRSICDRNANQQSSISELFVMQRYLQPCELERRLVLRYHRPFCKESLQSGIEAEGGGYRMRIASSVSTISPNRWPSFVRSLTSKQSGYVGYSRPRLFCNCKAEIGGSHTRTAGDHGRFILRAEAIRTGRVKPEEDNMLKLTAEARLI